MFGLGNLVGAMRQARVFSDRVQELNEKLKGQRVSASTGAGMVEVEANGLGDVLRVKIDPTLVERGEREMIEDLLPAAINQAVTKAKQLHLEAMKALTADLKLPGFDEAYDKLIAGRGGDGDADTDEDVEDVKGDEE